MGDNAAHDPAAATGLRPARVRRLPAAGAEPSSGDHVLVLGILSLVVCGVIGPFAWTMGTRVVGEIEASGGRWGGHTEATIGRILGIVATALLVVSALFFLALVTFGGSLLFSN
jgi:uncharacterized membrane protein YjgN (DUF898 family)